MPQSVLSNPLGVKLVPHSGVVGPRKLGDPFDESQVGPFFKLLTTDDGILAGSPDAASQPLGAGHSHPPAHLACDRLQQADQAQVPPHVAAIFFFKSSPPSSLPAFNSTKKRKRKKAVAGLPVVEVALLHISPLLSCLNLFYI